THSCGTAMTAATFAACWEGVFPFDTPVRVFNAGGLVICTAHRAEGKLNHSGLLAGNATFEWDGEAQIDWADANPLQHVRRVRDRDEEIRAYERFKGLVRTD
ncbi:MAG: diaminopimelate epimerase, partial [Magnetococcales bacterium]|nr:diaminopimelate epimerase [Magnetococcales bacterium]